MTESKEKPFQCNIRLLREEDLPRVAEIYSEAFAKADIGEQWTPETAEKFMRWWYEKQPDMFLVAESGGEVVGGLVAGIKPWWNGNHLVDGELFVHPDYQRRGIARGLLAEIIKRGIDQYEIVEFEGLATGATEFPIGWYERIGIKRTNWVHIAGDAREILNNLALEKP